MQENDENKSPHQAPGVVSPKNTKTPLGQLKQDNCDECTRPTVARDLSRICQNCMNKFRGKKSDRDVVDEFLGSVRAGDRSIEAMMKKHGWVRKEERD